MSQKITRRTFSALAGVAAVGVSTVRAFAQTDNEFTVTTGQVVKWIAPWRKYSESWSESAVPGSIGLYIENGAEFAHGYFAEATTIEEASGKVLEAIGLDPAANTAIYGEETELVDQAGAVQSAITRLLHKVTFNDSELGLLLELVDGTGLTLIASPIATFEADFASAQQSITVNDVPVFDGVVASDLQTELDAPAAVAGGGEYTDASGELHVVWSADWREVERSDDGVVITNTAETVHLYPQTYLLEGKTVQQDAEEWLATHLDDQGADGVVIGSEFTDTNFWYATNGEYGIRFGEGALTTDPNRVVMVFAANIALDEADPAALLDAANAGVTVNGAVPFPSVQKFKDVYGA